MSLLCSGVLETPCLAVRVMIYSHGEYIPVIKCIGYKQNHGADPDLLPPHCQPVAVPQAGRAPWPLALPTYPPHPYPPLPTLVFTPQQAKHDARTKVSMWNGIQARPLALHHLRLFRKGSRRFSTPCSYDALPHVV